MSSQSEDEKRLFLGIEAPESIGDAILKLRIRHRSLPGIRWVPHPHLHITTYFLGNVPTDMIPNLISLVRLSIREMPAFDLTFSHFCFAPKPKEPRMIWARYRKADAFRDLVTGIDRLYKQIKPRQQNRKSPIPHITVARLRDFRDQEAVDFDIPVSEKTFQVRELVLWESGLTPSGARYTEIERFTFSQKK